MTNVVIAENHVKRAGRLEARTIGFVTADSLDQAGRLDAEKRVSVDSLTIAAQNSALDCA